MDKVVRYEWHGSGIILFLLFILGFTLPFAVVYFMTHLLRIETEVKDAGKLSDFLAGRKTWRTPYEDTRDLCLHSSGCLRCIRLHAIAPGISGGDSARARCGSFDEPLPHNADYCPIQVASFLCWRRRQVCPHQQAGTAYRD